jgi:hypothetical protein
VTGGAASGRGRQVKVLRAVVAVAGFRRGLVNGLAGYADEDEWASRWIQSRRGEDNDIAAVERQFERIVNAWQDEIFDVLEDEAAERGLTPKPPRGQADSKRWVQDAIDLGVLTQPPADGQAPGRWDRLVLLGFMDPSRPPALRVTANVRQLFQHRYTQVEDEAHGRDVWQAMQELLQTFPGIAADIDAALTRLWPETREP